MSDECAAENVDTIPEGAFRDCQELIEVEGHNKLRKIEKWAFNSCRRLRRVTKMRGLIEIEKYAFGGCTALRDSELELDRVEIIGQGAFIVCNSLRSINLPSIRRVCYGAFSRCRALTDAVFGKDLERIEGGTFFENIVLGRIVIPLKHNLVIDYNAFNIINNLSRVDTLAGGIHETISSLHLESWRNEMEDEIDSINQTLPNIPNTQSREKSEAIQQWITRVLDRMEHYKTEHQILLKEAMTLLELALWKANLRENEADDEATQEVGTRVTRGQRKRKRNDRCITSGASIVIKNVLPFLTLQ
jgi:hypothetical protein